MRVCKSNRNTNTNIQNAFAYNTRNRNSIYMLYKIATSNKIQLNLILGAAKLETNKKRMTMHSAILTTIHNLYKY